MLLCQPYYDNNYSGSHMIKIDFVCYASVFWCGRRISSPWIITLLVLFMLLVVCVYSLYFLAWDKWLNMLNSHVIFEVLNLVHKCTIHCHSLGDADHW